MARGAVLVADDDGDVRTMVRTLLELDGHEVLEAPDGKAAWQLIVERRPAVVVADVSMPGFDGLELCRRIKGDRLLTTQVIVYTAGMATEAESQSAGCVAYLVKTDSVARLRETVRQYSIGPA
jgi:CheY-like chemotaxis protein